MQLTPCTRSVGSVSLVAMAFLFLACKRQPPTEATRADTPPSAPEPASAASQPERASGADAGSGSEAVAGGEWIDSTLYRFRFEGVRPCGHADGASHDGGAADVMRVGALVSIEAKLNKFAISPRDVTLESGGVILQAMFPGEDPGCSPALGTKPLKAGQVARGLVVFDVPAGFKGDIKLAYRPTRWGGAERVALNVPACLASCPP